MEHITDTERESNDLTTSLEIHLNEEYKIKIETGNQFKNSIFKDVYKNALKNVIEIIKQSEKESQYDDFNNIIAFTGERGKGKSSSMISFRESLIDKSKPDHTDFFKKDDNDSKIDYDFIQNKSFAAIDIIDPSLFRGGESLFEIILAKMFQKFQDALKIKVLLDEDRRNLINHFQEVFKNLQIINSDRQDIYKKESIEALSKLATSSNLKDKFKDLVKNYLEKFEKGKEYLVIAIDDFDLNTEGAYLMLEDIRQFLIQKNIILLIACKIEQLRDAIEIYYKEKNNVNEIDNKINKYLEKLLPFKRRLILPDVQKIKNLDLKILDNRKELFDIKSSDLSNVLSSVLFENFEVYLPISFHYNNFYPHTIRESQNFFNVLQEEKNYNLLKNYLLLEVNNKKIYNEVFLEIEDSDNVYLNLLTIRILNKTFGVQELKGYSSSKLPEKISIGDVIFALLTYEKRLFFDNYKEVAFLDYLKLYYFIRIRDMKDKAVQDNMLKYGFVNVDSKIMSEEEGTKSRDFVEFKGTIDLKKMNTEEKFILSQFMFILGDNKKTYRNEFEKDHLVSSYKKGILSPFSIFHNMINIDVLHHIFKFDKSDNFVKLNIKWFLKSKFITQLFNPNFTIAFLFELNKFRKLEVKEKLPNNYFDTICLLFVYGSVKSLENIKCNKSIINDFLEYPIVKTLILAFLSRNKINYKVVNDINNNHSLSIDKLGELKITDHLIDIINNLYDSFEPEEMENQDLDLIKEKLKLLHSRIKKNPNYKIITLSTIINEIKAIDEFHEVVDELSSYQDGIKSGEEDIVNRTKKELIDYLKNKING
ncbi:hypothetical protein [Chryseobacterium sp. RU33C]|uniref:hypothetical protein n=1 Tax=Chryseobacterium sp. RU33C TaxID=1907398 RepID=UPI000953BEBC|nr:hypothetical protein [Chryseobacterium sp. RU33C]SIQ50637.1 hypothetical protein SAMN05880573_10652 [Chryseobacterium sp. RU33C]